MKSHIFEFIVGLGVVLVAGWFLLSIVSKSDQLSSIGDTTKYFASFNDVSGISVGSDIKLAGVNVGKVLELKLDNTDYLVEMVNDEYAIENFILDILTHNTINSEVKKDG